MTSEASFNAFDALYSPSAAITLAFASLVASASAAIERWSSGGRATSFISTLSTYEKNVLVKE